MKTYKFIIMIITILFMLAIPITTIVRWNTARAQGIEYKFKCRLYDPVDLFRGRYVALSFDNNIADLGEPEANYEGKTSLFVTLTVDTNGYAVIERAYTSKPSTGTSIRVSSNGYVENIYSTDPSLVGNTTQAVPVPIKLDPAATKPNMEYSEPKIIKRAIRITLPFDRYYMDENKAPKAEEKIREDLQNNKNVYLNVKIHNSITAPVGLYIDGKRIEDVL